MNRWVAGSILWIALISEADARIKVDVTQQSFTDKTGESNHLTIANDVFTDPICFYNKRVRDCLLRNAEERYLVRMIAFPNNSPEWMVTVKTPTNLSAVIEVVRATTQIAGAEKVPCPKLDKRSAKVDVPTAKSLYTLWVNALAQTRYPKSPAPLILGRQVFHFSTYVRGPGWMAGEARWPAQKAVPTDLIKLGCKLALYVDAKPSARAKIEAELKGEAERILKELP